MIGQDPIQAAARPLEEVADGYCCYTPHHALDPLPVFIVGEGGEGGAALFHGICVLITT